MVELRLLRVDDHDRQHQQRKQQQVQGQHPARVAQVGGTLVFDHGHVELARQADNRRAREQGLRKEVGVERRYPVLHARHRIVDRQHVDAVGGVGQAGAVRIADFGLALAFGGGVKGVMLRGENWALGATAQMLYFNSENGGGVEVLELDAASGAGSIVTPPAASAADRVRI